MRRIFLPVRWLSDWSLKSCLFAWGCKLFAKVGNAAAAIKPDWVNSPINSANQGDDTGFLVDCLLESGIAYFVTIDAFRCRCAFKDSVPAVTVFISCEHSLSPSIVDRYLQLFHEGKTGKPGFILYVSVGRKGIRNKYERWLSKFYFIGPAGGQIAAL